MGQFRPQFEAIFKLKIGPKKCQKCPKMAKWPKMSQNPILGSEICQKWQKSRFSMSKTRFFCKKCTFAKKSGPGTFFFFDFFSVREISPSIHKPRSFWKTRKNRSFGQPTKNPFLKRKVTPKTGMSFFWPFFAPFCDLVISFCRKSRLLVTLDKNVVFTPHFDAGPKNGLKHDMFLNPV